MLFTSIFINTATATSTRVSPIT